jgi:GDP-4-dehydro-6-deoxy-D-mannose reductase
VTSLGRCLVTGAAGFAGRWLADELLAHGASVVGTALPGDLAPPPARLGRCELAAHDATARYRCADGEWTLRPLDLLDAAGVAATLAKQRPAVVFHLAAQSSAGHSFADAAGTFAVNVLGAVHLVEAALALPADARPRLVIIGSAEEYGPSPDRRPFHERSPTRPVSPYGASKLAQTAVGLQAAAAHGLDVVVVRPFPHVGPGQDPRFAYPSWAAQIAAAERGEREPVIEVGDLTPVRDLLHVGDVVRAYRLLADPAVPGGVYNICGGVGTSMQTGLDILRAAADVDVRLHADPSRIRPADIPWLVGDGTKLRAATGWSPAIEPITALRELLQWTRENRL